MNAPVVTTLATALPFIDPKNPLETTATLAGPPLLDPAIAIAKSLKNCPIPEDVKNAPKSINKNMYVDDTPIAIPNIPSVDRYIYSAICVMLYPLWAIILGSLGPKYA